MPTVAPPLPSEPDYWSESRRPWPCLIFLLPWMLVYEAGVVLLSSSDAGAARNGADWWMRTGLSLLGIKSALLLPLLVIGILLTWHSVREFPWRFRPPTLGGMMAESLLWAAGLIVLGQLHGSLFSLIGTAADSAADPSVTAAVTGETPGRMSQAVSYVGAGVYEEVMFRLMLVPIALVCFRLMEFPKTPAAVMAVLCTSFMFAIAHYVGSSADTFTFYSFSFRAMAGIFFATVFLIRGFGVTVGCHAVYDLLVGICLLPPQQ